MLLERRRRDGVVRDALTCVLKHLGARHGFLAIKDVGNERYETVPWGIPPEVADYCWQEILRRSAGSVRPVQFVEAGVIPRGVVAGSKSSCMIKLSIGEDPPAYLCAILDREAGRQELNATLITTRQLLAWWWRELANLDHIAAAMVLEERNCLRREIHDSVAQTLSYLILRLRTLMVLAEEKNQTDLQAGLRELLEVSNGVYLELRESLSSLWTPDSPDKPLATLVTTYAREFEERSGIRIRVNTGDSWQESLDRNTRTQLLRIVQEALTNVRKHARAQEVEITMEQKADGQLVLRIRDNGYGFDPQSLGRKRQQFGITGMKERAGKVGAKLVINSAHRAGTEVVVYLPPRGRGWRNEQVEHFVS